MVRTTRSHCAEFSRSVVSDSATPRTVCPPGSSAHGDSPGKNTEVGCHALLLQGIFPNQVSRIAGGFFTVLVTREARKYRNE